MGINYKPIFPLFPTVSFKFALLEKFSASRWKLTQQITFWSVICNKRFYDHFKTKTQNLNSEIKIQVPYNNLDSKLRLKLNLLYS